MAHHQPLTLQAQLAYDAALNSSFPDWRGVAELFRAALRTAPVAKSPKPPQAHTPEIADYSVDRIKLKCRSPRLAVRFMDGEAVFTHVPSAPRKPLNVGRALRVAIIMYRSPTRSSAAVRLQGVRRCDASARDLSGSLLGDGRAFRRGRVQRAHGGGAGEQRP